MSPISQTFRLNNFRVGWGKISTGEAHAHLPKRLASRTNEIMVIVNRFDFEV
jgi:hypothetical protein